MFKLSLSLLPLSAALSQHLCGGACPHAPQQASLPCGLLHLPGAGRGRCLPAKSRRSTSLLCISCLRLPGPLRWENLVWCVRFWHPCYCSPDSAVPCSSGLLPLQDKLPLACRCLTCTFSGSHSASRKNTYADYRGPGLALRPLRLSLAGHSEALYLLPAHTRARQPRHANFLAAANLVSSLLPDRARATPSGVLTLERAHATAVPSALPLLHAEPCA